MNLCVPTLNVSACLCAKHMTDPPESGSFGSSLAALRSRSPARRWAHLSTATRRHKTRSYKVLNDWWLLHLVLNASARRGSTQRQSECQCYATYKRKVQAHAGTKCPVVRTCGRISEHLNSQFVKRCKWSLSCSQFHSHPSNTLTHTPAIPQSHHLFSPVFGLWEIERWDPIGDRDTTFDPISEKCEAQNHVLQGCQKLSCGEIWIDLKEEKHTWNFHICWLPW